MKNLLVLVCLAVVTTSCSVCMAARKEGVDISKVQACTTRGQILAYGVTVISSERTSEGNLVEVYQIQKPRGSAARAFMHGALDVSTFGLWEVIGTPIEACADQKEYIMVRVYYNCQEIVQSIQLM